VFVVAPDSVAEIVSFVTGLAARGGLPAEKVARLEVAIEEWATNVCRHSYRGESGGLAVEVRRADPAIVIEFRDDGEPFDPTAAKDPDVTLPLAERAPGGLGLLLIRRMVDEVHYRRDGERNVVTFTMRR
jgi:serine/threonine-protein kinase RsbW